MAKHKDSEEGAAAPVQGKDHPLIQALVDMMPTEGAWPQASRDQWLAMFEQAIDLAYGPETPPAQ